MRKFLEAILLKAYSVRWMVFTGVILGACNFFNPAGTGDPGENSAGQLALGQSLFREKDFHGSMKAYEKAISQDSSNSLAYYGFAKAAMKHYGLAATTILDEVNSFNAGGTEGGGLQLPFINQENEVLTDYLQATSRVRKVLRLLTVRDTLTRWYQYSRNPDSKAARRDANAAARIAFIEDYLQKAESGTPGYRSKSKFPLSDLVLGYDKVIADFGLAEMLYALVHLRDLDGNDTIDTRDDLIKKLAFSSEGGFKIENLEEIEADLRDPENRANINALIRNTSDGMASASTVINLLGSMGGGSKDSLSNPELTGEMVGNIDSVVTSLGGAVNFYQFGDGIDNDGDGCIDEEILDGKDNDGDGFVDEDARLDMVDGIDNNRNGSEGPEDLVDLLDPARPLVFTQQSGWSTGPKYLDKAFRIWVQADSARTQSVIDSAKSQIGGCWNNY